MKRRTVLSAFGALAAGGAVTMGTGAFTATSADRQFSVSVADDSTAFLGLGPAPGPNGAYADGSDDGELELDFTEDNENVGTGIAGGSGINSNATTHFKDVFEIQNQGTQTVRVTVTPVGFFEADNGNALLVLLIPPRWAIDKGNLTELKLDVGESARFGVIAASSRDFPPGLAINDELTITAEAL